MGINITNHEIFNKPKKPFMLISQLVEGTGQMVMWHETEKDLLWLIKNNKGDIPV